MPKKKKIKPKVVARRYLGVQVNGPRKGIPSAYCMYKEFFSDGTTRTVPGIRVYGVALPVHPHSTTKTEQVRPDLYYSIEACAVLLGQLENACLAVDAKLLKPKLRADG